MSLSYLPEFVAKTESERDPLPRFLFVRSLEDFVAVLPEDRLLCLVRAIHIYLNLTASVSLCPHVFFVSPTCLIRASSTNALSFFLCKVIIDSMSLVLGLRREPIVFGVLRPRPCFCITGRSPRCFRQ